MDEDVRIQQYEACGGVLLNSKYEYSKSKHPGPNRVMYDIYFLLILTTKTVYKYLCYSVICHLLRMSDQQKCIRTTEKSVFLILLLNLLGSKTYLLKTTKS